MRIPSSIRDGSAIRILISIDGSFQESLELTGAELKKLQALIGVGKPVVDQVHPVLKAGDAAAEQRSDQPKQTVETRAPVATNPEPETVTPEAATPGATLPENVTESPDSTSNPEVK